MIYVNARAIIERELNHTIQVLVQRRTKPGQHHYEFPGGQVNPYESLFLALRREVKEETGLDVVYISGLQGRVETQDQPVFDVECFAPYAVYQTLRGPVDSMGVYFKCRATGELLTAGDDTADIRWISLEALDHMMATEGLFSGVDRAAAQYYLANR